ncbi:nucleopolyhedrovirus P10 family protein [Streptomyces sp. NBC_01198]|uniref:nucleopolyhedrovirus P10 family protein n=1 Tax=Streptomyces sp. NBC_01198 TaxID=2903769 RepID=UPI002E14861E|nr:nucleopolyhedrovirus P10 family protein [Streptomyces sp. NBC_01198]
MDRLARTVREQVALGRLLPLGEAGDAAWITESAAVAALRRAAAVVPGVRLGAVALTVGEVAPEPERLGSAAPVGALPYLPLRITADFEASLDEPLPHTADRLRAALWAAAGERLGLPVASVDLAVTGLIDGEVIADPVLEGVVVDDGDPARELAGGPAAGDPAARVAAAALLVPGVVRLTRRLAGLGAGVRVRDTAAGEGDYACRRVQLQFAVAAGHRPYVVARAVTAAIKPVAVTDSPGPVLTAVVVTDTQ